MHSIPSSLLRFAALRLGLAGALLVLPGLVSAATLTPEEARLKGIVAAYEKKLAPMETWQKRIFTEEVVPQFQRFLRAAPTFEGTPGAGGHSTATATNSATAGATGAPPNAGNPAVSELPQTEVDEELVKSYLSFYAPKVLQIKDPKILVYLQWDDTCAKCKVGERNIRTLARARSLRRGMQPTWVEKEELSFPLSETLQHLDAKLLDLMKQKEAVAILAIQWAPAAALGVAAPIKAAVDDPEAETPPAASSDPSVPSSQNPALSAAAQPLVLRLSLRLGERFLEKTKILEENDRLESAQALLLNEAFTELGKAQQAVRADSTVAGVNEKILQVSGIHDFAQLARIKAQLQSQIKEVISVQERKISRGQVSLSVVAKASESELTQQLENLHLDPGHEAGLSKDVQK